MNKQKQTILYEDDALVVVHKPAGVDAQASAGFSQDMVSILKNDMAARGMRNPYVGVVHRLDKTVEGLLVYGKSKQMTAALCEQIANRQMNKCYCALVHGIPKRGEELLEDYLSVNRSTRNAVIATPDLIKHGEAKLCRLIYRNVSGESAWIYPPFAEKLQRAGYTLIGEQDCYVPVNEWKSDRETDQGTVSMVLIQLLTGRYHQIRAQLSHRGYPIVGDRRYGMSDKGSMPDRAFAFPALCAVSLSFLHPVSGEEMNFSLLP